MTFHASDAQSGVASPTTNGTFTYLPNGGAGLYQFAIQSVDRAQNRDNPTPSVAGCATAYSQ